MPRLTLPLLTKGAELNDCALVEAVEVDLHGKGLEAIELVGSVCRRLRVLHLQNNLIPRIQQLHRLKELEVLNLAVNNIRRVQNLQRCESLRRLDLSLNFVAPAGLPSLHSLRENEQLEELSLLGNPCAAWPGYRPYVLGVLPSLRRLDGEEVLPSERISAAQQLPALEARLAAELEAAGVDPEAAAAVEDDSLMEEELAAAAEAASVNPETGEVRRPWCPATRLLEHRERAAEAAAAEAQRAAAQATGGELGAVPEPPLRACLPPLPENGEPFYQKNEGKWEFSLGEAPGGVALQLDVALGKYLDSSAVQADVQPRCVRLLAKGRLLQLALPAEVAPDAAVAQRSRVTGNLLITMPLAAAGGTIGQRSRAGGVLRPAASVANAAAGGGSRGVGSGKGQGTAAAPPAAVVSVVAAAGGVGAEGEDDELPPL